mmetsp:Transcript_54687/g.97572  ORF Transcript_54687/g.97572 Transcript_54687/m.97572 type:complete len:103 (+) Transcript_54687:164-472(+)
MMEGFTLKLTCTTSASQSRNERFKLVGATTGVAGVEHMLSLKSSYKKHHNKCKAESNFCQAERNPFSDKATLHSVLSKHPGFLPKVAKSSSIECCRRSTQSK